MRAFAFVSAFGLLLLGCASAQVETAWKDPAVAPGDFAFQKVLVLVRAKDVTARRAGEDELVRYLKSGPRGQAGQLNAVPSYSLLDSSDLPDREKVRALVKAQGFDGLVMMSFVSAKQEVTVVPASYGGVWGYYGASPYVYDPGYVRTDTIVRVETRIYRISDEKLLWASISRDMNPSNVPELVQSVAKSVGEGLRKQGLIP